MWRWHKLFRFFYVLLRDALRADVAGSIVARGQAVDRDLADAVARVDDLTVADVDADVADGV